MKRIRQTFENVENSLSRVESTWMDAHAGEVISMLKTIPVKKKYGADDIKAILDRDFKVGFTVIRLFVDQSKDEFVPNLKEALGKDGNQFGSGIKCYKAIPEKYIKALINMGLAEDMSKSINRRLQWHDVLRERLKSGRGSATKGQARGRNMENFVEQILQEVFSAKQIAVRCRFIGANGLSYEKTDRHSGSGRSSDSHRSKSLWRHW
ncbi:MAG: hypothetical protein LAT55_08425 [Opitutales bacterium]|nr:hypothetical protein [Opitutales bacterium]